MEINGQAESWGMNRITCFSPLAISLLTVLKMKKISYLHDIFGFSVPTVYTFRATLQVTVKWQVIWEIITVLSLYYAAKKMNEEDNLKGQYRKMLKADQQRAILRIAGWRCWTHWIWVKEYEITLWNIEPVLHVHGEFKRTSEIESEGDAFTGYHLIPACR